MAVPLQVLCVLICCCLLQTQDCTGQSLLGSSLPVVASVGGEVVLPCFFRPPKDVSGLTLEWSRPDADPRRVVFVWQSRRELTDLKHSQFIGRTSLFKDELSKGNITLRLTNVRIEDSGRYRCFVPVEGEETFIKLIISSSSPVVVSVSAVQVWSSAVQLQCESEAWYPQPELCWLDSDGRLLSVDHTPPLPRPDGLYDISSRLTVEHSGNYTCRVSQSAPYSSTQDTVRITDDVFGNHVWILSLITALVVALVLFIGFAVVLLILYSRRLDTNQQTSERRQENQDSHRATITRLEEENEILKSELDSSKTIISGLKEDNDNLKTEVDSYIKLYQECFEPTILEERH